MKKLKEALKQENIACGYLYFYVHFIVEITCFYFLSKISNSPIIWLIPFIYDAFAFVPQSLIGYLCDCYPKLKVSIIGTILLFIGIFLFSFFSINKFLLLFIICFGNAFIHVGGAECTLRKSKGKLSHSALFVAGGSFGVISGRILANTFIPSWVLLPVILSMIPFILYADTFKGNDCTKFNYCNLKMHGKVVVFLAFIIVIVRGYMGYGIPTSWNKSTIETVYLFSIMGLGKALGGILSDAFGIRKIALISTLLAIPFLIIGDNFMIISLIGVMFFSMTMSITLAVLVSCLRKNPGLAFGITTIGLFLGTVPIFFFQIVSNTLNSIMIIVLSLLCTIILNFILKREGEAYD